MNSISRSLDDIVDDITRLHRSLPPRPHIDEVDAAVALLRAIDKEEKVHIEAILKQQEQQKRSLDVGSGGVPEELLVVQEQLQKNLVEFRSREQKREALKLLDLENTHAGFDELVQRAERCLSPAAAAVLVEKRSSNEFGRRSDVGSNYLDKGKIINPTSSVSGEDKFDLYP